MKVKKTTGETPNDKAVKVDAEKKKLLHKFVINNEQLDQLKTKSNVFNPLAVLNVKEYEIRHSNILAWLLNPNESHGLGDLALKKIIGGILLDNPDCQPKIDPWEFEMASLGDVRIYREWSFSPTENSDRKRGLIDIVLVSPANKYVIYIENKIRAGEGDKQLSDYFNAISKNYPCWKILPIYLTLTGEEAADFAETKTNEEDVHKKNMTSKYLSFSHASIGEIVKSVLDVYQERMNSKVSDFLCYYIRTIENMTSPDPELIELCKQIYSKHKEAIDLIVEHGLTTEFANACDLLADQNWQKNYKKLKQKKDSLWFLPMDLADRMNGTEMKVNWVVPFPIAMWFRLRENMVQLIIEIGPAIQDLRNEIFKELRGDKNKYNLLQPSLQALSAGKFTCIYSKFEPLNEVDWNDPEAIASAMQALLENAETTNATLQVKQLVEKIFKQPPVKNLSERFSWDARDEQNCHAG